MGKLVDGGKFCVQKHWQSGFVLGKFEEFMENYLNFGELALLALKQFWRTFKAGGNTLSKNCVKNKL
jgi:hypothetical protein